MVARRHKGLFAGAALKRLGGPEPLRAFAPYYPF